VRSVILKEECFVVKFCLKRGKTASKMHEMRKTILVKMPWGEQRLLYDFLNSDLEEFHLKTVSFQVF
jgi:hypothetical protein